MAYAYPDPASLPASLTPFLDDAPLPWRYAARAALREFLASFSRAEHDELLTLPGPDGTPHSLSRGALSARIDALRPRMRAGLRRCTEHREARGAVADALGVSHRTLERDLQEGLDTLLEALLAAPAVADVLPTDLRQLSLLPRALTSHAEDDHPDEAEEEDDDAEYGWNLTPQGRAALAKVRAFIAEPAQTTPDGAISLGEAIRQAQAETALDVLAAELASYGKRAGGPLLLLAEPQDHQAESEAHA